MLEPVSTQPLPITGQESGSECHSGNQEEKDTFFQAEINVFYSLPSSFTIAFLQAATTYCNIVNNQQEQR